MLVIGSQRRETVDDAGYEFDTRLDSETIVLLNEDKEPEVWGLNDDHAGWTLEYDGKGYEFIRSGRR